MHTLVFAALLCALSSAVEFVTHDARHRLESRGAIRLKRRAIFSHGKALQDPDADTAEVIKEAEEEAAAEEAKSNSGPAPAPENKDGMEADGDSKAAKKKEPSKAAKKNGSKSKRAKSGKEGGTKRVEHEKAGPSNEDKKSDVVANADDESESELDNEVAKAEAEERKEEKEDDNADAPEYPSVSWKTKKGEETADQRIHRHEVEDLEHAIARETKSTGLAVMLGGLKLDMYQLQDQMDMMRKDIENGVRIEKKDPADALFYPVSTCMWCILMLAAQYFVVYGAMAVCKLFTEAFSLGDSTICELSLKAACDTVFYAPMLSVLFLGTQLRAQQIAEGRQGPSESGEKAMQVCVWSLLAQTIIVLAIPILTGGDKVASKSDERGVQVPEMQERALAGIFTLIRYVAMISLLLGIFVVCAEVVLMDARTLGVDPPDLWDDPTTSLTEYAPPVSVAMTCTIFLMVFFCSAYLLRALLQSIVEFSSGNPDGQVSRRRSHRLADPRAWVTEGELCLHACANTLNLAPMLCILFVAARMRALQMDAKLGKPQAWAENCFYVCTAALILNIGVIIVAHILGLGSVPSLIDSGRTTGTASQPSASEFSTHEMSGGEKAVLALRVVALFIIYLACFGVVVSIFTIRAPEGRPTPAVSPTLQCVIFLTTLYFAVYFGSFISKIAAIGKASGDDGSAAQQDGIQRTVCSFCMAEYTVRFCPMLAVLFVGTRMRALHMSGGKGSPQCWAQDAMYITCIAAFGQLMLAFLAGGFARKAAVDEAGSPVARTSYIPGKVFLNLARVLVLLALYGSVAVVCASVLAIRPESAHCDNPRLLSFLRE